MSVTVPSTQHGSPAAPAAISPPSGIRGDPSTKNGPTTVASVALAYASLLMVIICIDAPSTSDSKMNSWRLSSVMSPGLGQERDGVPPLVLGQPDFTHEGVQMPGQRLHHLPQPGVARMGERGEDAV